MPQNGVISLQSRQCVFAVEMFLKTGESVIRAHFVVYQNDAVLG